MNDIRKALSDAYDSKEIESEEEIIDSSDEIEDLVETEEVTEEDIEVSEDNELEADSEEAEAEEQEITEPEDDIKAPQFWREDKKQAFSQLPRELKEEVLRLDKEQQGYVTKLAQESSQLRNAVQGFNQVLEPYRDVIMQSGVSPEQYTKNLYYWDSKLMNNPEQAILEIAEANGVDINRLTMTQQEVDPQVRSLEQKYAALEQQMQAQKQAEAEQKEQQLLMEVQAFENDAPYLKDERVMQEMISLVPGLKNSYPQATNRQLLEEAYNRAVLYFGLNKDVQAQEKKPTSIKQAKNKAKKTASSVSGSGTSGKGKVKAGTTREALELSLQQLGM